MSLFTEESLTFLKNLRNNNNRDWFLEHKPEYQQFVLEPLRSMAENLKGEMEGFDPLLKTDPKRVVSRIYRDTRFTNDKSPYKTAGFILWRRPIDDRMEAPTYFFEITPDDYRFGVGTFDPSAKVMANFRLLLEQDPGAFEQILSWINWKQFTLINIPYKRPFPNTLPDALQPYYQSKSFYLSSERTPDKLLYSNRLCKTMADEFMRLKPMYDFLWKVKSQADGSTSQRASRKKK